MDIFKPRDLKDLKELMSQLYYRREESLIQRVDIFSLLLKERIIFLGLTSAATGHLQVTDTDAALVVAQLLYLDAEEPGRDINLYINSIGGTVSGMMAIYDTMQFIKSDVCTVCVGQAVSAAAFLLAAGTKGKRFALPNSKIMIHQPTGGVYGTAADTEIEIRELLKDRDRINELLAKHTGQPIEKIRRDTDRNFWMSAQEAKNYGIIDDILVSRKTLEKK